MAAPKHVPTAGGRTSYTSPARRAAGWSAARPGEVVESGQPSGGGLGYQGPDQGFAYKIAAGFRDRLHLEAEEDLDDVIEGGVQLGLRRASLFGRAPVVHDLTVAFTIWGYLDESPSDELVTYRSSLFKGVSHHHHYDLARELCQAVSEAALRVTPERATGAYTSDWKTSFSAL